jgi:surface protein
MVGAVTLFTNLSINGRPSIASADTSPTSYDSETKTLTIGPGELQSDISYQAETQAAETIVFVSPGASSEKVIAPDAILLFAYLPNLKQFKGMENFDTSQTTQMKQWFDCDTNLETIDLTSFDTSKVISMEAMFWGCSSLTTLDLSSFNTSMIYSTYAENMFDQTTSLWKLTLGPNCHIVGNLGLQNPVIGTQFNQNYIVNSDKWVQQGTGVEYTAGQIMSSHVNDTDTYTWQGSLLPQEMTTEYTVQSSYTVTIPAQITIPSATTVGTGLVTLSAYPKLPFDNHFIHITATSNASTAWHLTSTGDTTGAEYNFGTTSGGSELKNPGGQLVFTADGESAAQDQSIYAGLTDTAHNFKYAGSYMDTVTFNIQTAAS